MGVLRPFSAAQVKKHHSPETIASFCMAELGNKLKKVETTQADESHIYDTKTLHSRNPGCSTADINAGKNEETNSLLKKIF